VILGLVLFGVGSALMFRVMKTHEGQLLTSLPLKASVRAMGDLVSAPKDPNYEVRFTFVTKSHENHPHFKFPVSYRIVDEKGRVIFSEETVADPDGARAWSMASVSRSSAPQATSAHAEFIFGHFEVEAPGRLHLEAELKPDAQTHEEAIEPYLHVYHHVPQGPPREIWAFLLPLGGLALVIIGLALLIVGWFLRKRRVTVPHK
jgi:hypothetical protein